MARDCGLHGQLTTCNTVARARMFGAHVWQWHKTFCSIDQKAVNLRMLSRKAHVDYGLQHHSFRSHFAICKAGVHLPDLQQLQRMYVAALQVSYVLHCRHCST